MSPILHPVNLRTMVIGATVGGKDYLAVLHPPCLPNPQKARDNRALEGYLVSHNLTEKGAKYG